MTCSGLFLAAVVCFYSAGSQAAIPVPPDDPAGCDLLDLTTLLEKSEFVTTTGQPPLTTYQNLVSRFISLHYSKVARHLLHEDGHYLDTLHQLIGIRETDRHRCNRLFRDMLLSSPGPASFTQALLLFRLSPIPSDQAGSRHRRDDTTDSDLDPLVTHTNDIGNGIPYRQ